MEAEIYSKKFIWPPGGDPNIEKDQNGQKMSIFTF
jgi:hypothetical protein